MSGCLRGTLLATSGLAFFASLYFVASFTSLLSIRPPPTPYIQHDMLCAAICGTVAASSFMLFLAPSGWLRFSLRRMFILVTTFGVIFFACARWPVIEYVDTTTSAHWVVNDERPPTIVEWALRVGACSAVLLASFSMVVTLRTPR